MAESCQDCSSKYDARHFWLSLVVLIGGGVLMVLDKQTMPFVSAAQGLCLGFWFGRQGTNGNGNGRK